MEKEKTRARILEIAEKKIKKEWEGIVPIETHPYPLKNFEGTLEIAEQGFPFLGTAKLQDLIKIYPLYLALCVENPMPLISLRENKRLELKEILKRLSKTISITTSLLKKLPHH